MDTQRFKNLCLHWNNNAQKVQFISNLKGQVHLYIHFLMLITRYYAGKVFLFISNSKYFRILVKNIKY